MAALTEKPHLMTRDNSPQLSKSMKRSNKPLMEKRRRERINSSLNQLKNLVLDALKKDTSQYSKLEKADILEMTVKHLRGLQRQHLTVASTTDATVFTKYRAGFTECAGEVGRYLSTVDGLSPEVRDRLMHHLSNSMQRINGTMAMHHQHTASMEQLSQPIQIQIPVATQPSVLPGTTVLQAPPSVSPVNPQGVQYIGAFQVVPGATVSPDVAAFVVPSSSSAAPVGLVNNVSPIYMTSSSPLQQQPRDLRQETVVANKMQQRLSTEKELAPQVVPQYTVPRGCSHKSVDTTKAVVKESLKEEKVWRPW